MANHTGSTIQDRLALSLDRTNQREAIQKAADPIPAPERGCTKLSVSLFSGDMARLDAIRDYMQTRGYRISTSQAIKLALRTAALTPHMDAALDAIRGEDGRSKW